MNFYSIKINSRFRFVVILIFFMVVPLVLAIGLVAARFNNVQIENAARFQQKTADAAAREFSGFTSSQFASLEEVLRIYFEPDISQSLAEKMVDKILFANKALVDISVVDGDGKEIFRRHRFRVIQPNELRRRIEDVFLAARVSESYISPMRFEDSKPVFTIVRANFGPSGSFAGAALATVDARNMQKVIGAISFEDGGGRAYVVDKSGGVIAHPDLSNVLGEKNFSFIPIVDAIRTDSASFDFKLPYKNELGEKVIGAFSLINVVIGGAVDRSLNTPWFIIAERPLGAATAPVKEIIIFITAIISFVLVLMTTIGFVISRGIKIEEKSDLVDKSV